MQKMTPAERTAYVSKLKQKRDGLNKTLGQLTRKRAAYIETEQKRLAAAGMGDAFDTKVAEIIASEAARAR
jgi:hypothetical protein